MSSGSVASRGPPRHLFYANPPLFQSLPESHPLAVTRPFAVTDYAYPRPRLTVSGRCHSGGASFAVTDYALSGRCQTTTRQIGSSPAGSGDRLRRGDRWAPSRQIGRLNFNQTAGCRVSKRIIQVCPCVRFDTARRARYSHEVASRPPRLPPAKYGPRLTAISPRSNFAHGPVRCVVTSGIAVRQWPMDQPSWI